MGIHGDRVVLVLGGHGDLRAAATSLVPLLGDGPVVLGPVVPTVLQASQSARSALAGLAAARGWPDAPRPAQAGGAPPERALSGDPEAIQILREQVYRPLAAASGPLVGTLAAYLESGRSLEAAARALFVHPNTVRYRLRRIAQVSGWDPSDAREGFVLQVALVLGRLADTGDSRRFPTKA
ncbi:PucR family transcriptional regulator [Salana multivorans]